MMEMGDETDDGSFFRFQRREWKAAIIKQKTNMKTTIKPKKPFRIVFYRLITMSLCVLRQWSMIFSQTAKSELRMRRHLFVSARQVLQ
jgi:hypothetical protein